MSSEFVMSTCSSLWMACEQSVDVSHTPDVLCTVTASAVSVPYQAAPTTPHMSAHGCGCARSKAAFATMGFQHSWLPPPFLPPDIQKLDIHQKVRPGAFATSAREQVSVMRKRTGGWPLGLIARRLTQATLLAGCVAAAVRYVVKFLGVRRAEEATQLSPAPPLSPSGSAGPVHPEPGAVEEEDAVMVAAERSDSDPGVQVAEDFGVLSEDSGRESTTRAETPPSVGDLEGFNSAAAREWDAMLAAAEGEEVPGNQGNAEGLEAPALQPEAADAGQLPSIQATRTGAADASEPAAGGSPLGAPGSPSGDYGFALVSPEVTRGDSTASSMEHLDGPGSARSASPGAGDADATLPLLEGSVRQGSAVSAAVPPPALVPNMSFEDLSGMLAGASEEDDLALAAAVAAGAQHSTP